MIKIDPTILIVAGEVMLALLVALVAILIYLFRGKSRDRAAAAELQGRLKGNAAKRQEWFESLLASSIENGDAEANRELAATWVEKENQFYNHLVNMYLKRNASALRGLDKQLHDYTSSYLELVSLMRTRIDEEQGTIPEEIKAQLEQLAQEGERLAAVVQTLEQENQRLNSELAAANSEIDQAMREYSVAFRPGSGMTGSAIAAAPVAIAAAAEAAVDEVEMAEPVAAMALDADEPSAEETGAELEALGAAIMAEGGGAAAADTALLEEMDLAAVDALAEPESKTEPAAEPAAADEWRASFDERPDGEPATEVTTAAAKGPVIDLADEGEILLPQLNELMTSIELPDANADEAMMGDPLAGDELPILDESVDGDGANAVDEARLLAELEGLEEGEPPSFASDIVMDELADLDQPPAKGKDAPANP
jgi:hypothetical protein